MEIAALVVLGVLAMTVIIAVASGLSDSRSNTYYLAKTRLEIEANKAQQENLREIASLHGKLAAYETGLAQLSKVKLVIER